MAFNTQIEQREECAPGRLGKQTYAVNTNPSQAFLVTIKSIQTGGGQPRKEHVWPPKRIAAGGLEPLGCSQIDSGLGTFYMTYEVVGETPA